MIILLPVYGSILVLVVIASVFNFFMTLKVSAKQGICLMIGALLFFACDNLVSHGAFDHAFKDSVTKSANAAMLMVVYYIGQFLLGKGGLAVAEYFEN